MKPVNIADSGSSHYFLKTTWRAIFRWSPSGDFPVSLPNTHPIAAFFILKKLKQLGYSNCKVKNSTEGLIVYADR